MGVELVCFCYITSEGIEPTRRLDLFKKAGPFQEGWTFSRRLDLFKQWAFGERTSVKSRLGKLRLEFEAVLIF